MSFQVKAYLLWWLSLFAIPPPFCLCLGRDNAFDSLRHRYRDIEGNSTNKGVDGQHIDQGECIGVLATPSYITWHTIVHETEAYYRILDLFMAAEPSVGRRRLRSDGSWQDPAGMQTILEEMDADLAQMDDTGGAAAAAATQVDTSTSSAAAAGAADGSETPAQQRATRPLAQRSATSANDVVIDPRLLAVVLRSEERVGDFGVQSLRAGLSVLTTELAKPCCKRENTLW